MNLPGLGGMGNSLADGVALAGAVGALLCIVHYNLRIYALYNGLWFWGAGRQRVRRYYGHSLLPLALLAAGAAALLPIALGLPLEATLVPVLLLVGGSTLLLLGFGGAALRHSPLGMLVLLVLVGVCLLNLARGQALAATILAWLLLVVLAALAYIYFVRATLARPDVPLRSRHLDGVVGSLMGVWVLWAWLRFLPLLPPVLDGRYGPAWLALALLLLVLSVLAPFGARDLVASLTRVELEIVGQTVVPRVRLLGLLLQVPPYLLPPGARLAVWVYGAAGHRYRAWHPRCLVSRSELVLLVPGAPARSLAYVEGPLGLLGSESRPLADWLSPSLVAQGELLASKLGLPITVEPVQRLTMPFGSVGGPGHWQGVESGASLSWRRLLPPWR